MTIRRLIKFPEDPNQRAGYDCWIGETCLRVFGKPWVWPYAFHRWGFYGFGAGPLGFMLWLRAERSQGRFGKNPG